MSLESLAQEIYDAALMEYPTRHREIGNPAPLLQHYRGLGLPGKTPFGSPEQPENSSHEIAHWYCAARYRRKLPLVNGEQNFGLGDSGACATHVSDEYSQREEEEASLLGILLEREFGCDWQGTASLHNWAAKTVKAVEKPLRRLLRKRLIDEDGRPTMLRREQP